MAADAAAPEGYGAATDAAAPEAPQGCWLELLPIDTGMLQHPTVSTITFFDGDAPTEHLKKRTEALLDANQWLAGRLKNGAPNGDAGVWIASTLDKSKNFVETSSEKLKPGISMEDTVAALEGELVQKGKACLDADEPLFKVVVVKTEPGKFAVVVSMSHVVADGFTYYALWSALGGDAAPPVFDAKRKPDFAEAMVEAVGEDQYGWQQSGGVKMMFVGNMIGNGLWGNPLERHAWYVSNEFIEAEKKKSKEAGVAAFVSTNDIITSWFFKRNKCDYALMAMNFRDRLLDLSSSHAGNYEGVINYWPDEFETPAGVRKALVTKGSFKAGRSDVPGFWSTSRSTLGMTTNWSGFAKELSLPKCKQALHYPIFETLGVFEALIIFRPTPDKIAFMIADRPGDMSKLDNSAMGEQIF